MAVEITLREAVLEELGEEMLILGESDEAVADVAGREHVEIFAKTSGGAAVIGDGDDGGEVADEAREGLAVFAGGDESAEGWGDEALKAAQERGEAGSAADGDDTKLRRSVHTSNTSVDGRRSSVFVAVESGSEI